MPDTQEIIFAIVPVDEGPTMWQLTLIGVMRPEPKAYSLSGLWQITEWSNISELFLSMFIVVERGGASVALTGCDWLIRQLRLQDWLLSSVQSIEQQVLMDNNIHLLKVYGSKYE